MLNSKSNTLVLIRPWHFSKRVHLILDLNGSFAIFIMFVALVSAVFLILAFTFGLSRGVRSASFIILLVLSITWPQWAS
ncbi:hypothetical protein WN943_022752 [Citrus x changshan-huyou]